MGRWRLRAALVTAYLLLLLATAGALWAFAQEVDDRLGADYTAAASDIVRGQYETATLRRAALALREAPSRFHQERMLAVLDNIRNQAATLRNALPRLGLEPDATGDAEARLQRALNRLPELRLETRRVLEAPERLPEFMALADEVEAELAYAYSTLHAINHRAAAAQQQLTWTLSVTVAGLGALLLVIIALLLGAVDRMLGQRHDLQQLTVTDPLTGLPNRRALLQRADWVLAQHRRNGRPVSLALIDVDHFKQVNDQDGHPAGDRVLKQLAARLGGVVRATDMVARLGGEEFGLLMPETSAREAGQLCERIRVAIETHPGPLTPHVAGLTVSIGVATSTPGTETAFDGLYARADRALYEAKHTGRNRVIAAGPARERCRRSPGGNPLPS